MKLDVAHRLNPVGRRQRLCFLPAHFQVLDQIQKQVHRPVLFSRWTMLINDRMNGDGGVDPRNFVTNLIGPEGLDDGDGAVLTIRRMAAPPKHAKDLGGVEMVHAPPPMLFMLMGGRSKAQPIETGAGNMAGNETSQTD